MSEPKQKPGGSSGPGLFHILGPDSPMNVFTPPAVSARAPPRVPHVQSCWWLHPPSQQVVTACVPVSRSCVCLFPQFPEYDDLYCKYCFVYGQDWAPTAVSWALWPPRLTAFVTGGVSEGSIAPFPLPVQNQLRVQGWHTR